MVDQKTGVLGLIGYPLEHSLSPRLHNQAIVELGLNLVYLSFPLKPEQLEDGIRAIRALGLRGVNVTIPYKERVLPYLDQLDPLAAKLGAVNTIVNNQGLLTGYNTDINGFCRMLEEDGGFRIRGKRALLLGAGGAARAVAFALCQQGIAALMIINRTADKARHLQKTLHGYYPGVRLATAKLSRPELTAWSDPLDLIVDTTPVGMAPQFEVEPVIPLEVIRQAHLVVDLVYNPPETSLLRAAAQVGVQGLNGMGMLLYQGIEAFKLWTGQEPELNSWRELVKSV